MEKRNPCIAMVPCPGFSHLLTLIEFAKRLAVYIPHFHFTFLIPTLGPPPSAAQSTLQSLPPHIDFIILPHVDKNDIPKNAVHPATQTHQTVILSLPSLSQALSSLSSHTQIVAIIADVFSVDVLEIAKQFNLKAYLYYAMSVTSLCFSLKFPELDEDHEMVSTGFRDLAQPLKLPGCVALHGKDLYDTVQDRSSESYKTILHICKRLRLADAVIVNSFLDLERGPITSLQGRNSHKYPPIYPVGPIFKTESTTMNESASNCLKWLDNQPHNSVLYVSFGSGGTLTYEQLQQLALGLEMSRHKFLWVVRAPSGSTSSAYFNSQIDNPLDYLPNGFIERTKSQGLVVPSWAPQIEILRHDSTGGFLTHCGWNSTLESVFYGKPLIVWPLFAEQRMNAVTLTEEFKVAVWPKVDENRNGIVVKEEVARVVKLIMGGEEEGNEIRRRVQVFKDAAAKVLDNDGSSSRMISSLAHELKNMSGM